MNGIPQHIALIIDGNRRWAKKKNLPFYRGHLAGADHFAKFCDWCKNKEVKIITAFLLSTENLSRSEREVNYLLNLLEKYLLDKKNQDKFQKDEVKVKIIGKKEKFSKKLQEAISRIENLTKNNKNMQLNLAVGYGGRWDILQSVKKITDNKIPSEKITEGLIGENLSTAGIPDPDLIIRTSGEQRVSNFLLWQIAYSEIYFSPKLWPDFTEKDLDEALEEYAIRKRRFGR